MSFHDNCARPSGRELFLLTEERKRARGVHFPTQHRLHVGGYGRGFVEENIVVRQACRHHVPQAASAVDKRVEGVLALASADERKRGERAGRLGDPMVEVGDRAGESMVGGHAIVEAGRRADETDKRARHRREASFCCVGSPSLCFSFGVTASRINAPFHRLMIGRLPFRVSW